MKNELIFGCFCLMLVVFGCTGINDNKNGFYDNGAKGNNSRAIANNDTNYSEITTVNAPISKINDSRPVNASKNLTIITNITNATSNNSQNLTSKNKTGYLEVDYFYSPVCPFCNAINSKIDQLEQKYENSTSFVRYSVFNQNDLDTYNNFTATYNVSERVVPLVFVNGTYLSGMFEINSTLEELIVNNTIYRTN